MTTLRNQYGGTQTVTFEVIKQLALLPQAGERTNEGRRNYNIMANSMQILQGMTEECKDRVLATYVLPLMMLKVSQKTFEEWYRYLEKKNRQEQDHRQQLDKELGLSLIHI